MVWYLDIQYGLSTLSTSRKIRNQINLLQYEWYLNPSIMDTRTVYYTPPTKSYRVLYSCTSSGAAGVGYGPTLEGMKDIVKKWKDTYGDSANWAIQEGRDGQWTTIEDIGYFRA
jgi:hypothetical protein